MDADPWGMYIYSVIKQGSISLSYSEEKLATPDTKYIGLTVGDVERYKIPKEVTIKLNQLDVKRLNEMAAYDWFKKKEWQAEFQLMKDKAVKLELEALSKKGIRFISEEYLPDKIKRKDFLPWFKQTPAAFWKKPVFRFLPKQFQIRFQNPRQILFRAKPQFH